MISIAPNGRTIAPGDSLQFQASANTGTSGFIWAVDHPDIASVDSTGLVRSLKAGTVFVRACAKAQSGLCGAATLTVQ